MRFYFSLTVSLCLILSATAPTPAQEQERQKERVAGLESITVTARKIEEDIQTTPVAVTALSAKELEQANFTEFKQIGYLTPNVRFENVPSQGMSATIGIRGVQQTDPGVTFDPSVGIYEDGIYNPRITNASFMLLDTERIEVLKGPQGTLFGKNTSAGAILVNSRDPDGSFGGWLRYRVGEDRLNAAEGAVGFPILGETLSARVAFLSTKHDGRIDVKSIPLLAGSPFDYKAADDVRDRGAKGFKAALRWLPSDSVEVVARGYRMLSSQNTGNPFVPSHFDQDFASSTTSIQLNTLIPTPDRGIGSGPAAFGGFFAWAAPPVSVTNPEVIAAMNFAAQNNDSETLYARGGTDEDLDSLGGSLKVSWDLGPLVITSLTGHREYRLDRRGATGQLAIESFTSNPLRDVDQPEKGRSFSQELQLTGHAFERLTWAGGAYFFKERVSDSSPAFFGFSGLPNPAAGLIFPASLTSLDSTKSFVRSWGVYGQGSLQLTERLSVTLGVRTNYERRKLVRRTTTIFEGPLIGTVVVPGLDSTDPARRFDPVSGQTIPEPVGRFDGVQWVAGLEFAATDDLFLFFRAARGFRSGGYNARPSNPVQLRPFDPEFVTTYELGAKSGWLDQRVRANLALFYSKYKDMQLSVLFPCSTGVCANIANRSSADISGGELEVATRLLPGLDLGGSLGVSYVRYTKGEFSSPRRDPQNVPILTYSLTGRYELPAFDAGQLAAGLTWFWQSDNNGSTLAGLGSTGSGTDRCRFCRRVRQNAYGVLNGRVSFSLDEHPIEIAVYGNNLFDREYFAGGTDLGEGSGFGVWTRNWQDRRNFGVELTYLFGSETER